MSSEILKRAKAPNLDALQEAALRGRTVFADSKREILTAFDAAISAGADSALKEARDKVSVLEDHVSVVDIVHMRKPGRVMTRDQRAQYEGVQAPPHIQFEAEVMSAVSCAGQLRELAGLARTAFLYLMKRGQVSKAEPVSLATVEPAFQERPWDLWVLGAFLLGVLAGKFGETALSPLQYLVLRLVGELPPAARKVLVGFAVATALTLAAVAGNLVASLIDRDGRGTLRVILQRPRVRLLILAAILLTALGQALGQ